MKTLPLAALALVAIAAGFAGSATSSPASADPICQFGFQTEAKTGWLLKCRKIVPMAQKGVALTQAGNANCTPDNYWNFGPAVTATHLRGNLMVAVRYTCGHVEG